MKYVIMSVWIQFVFCSFLRDDRYCGLQTGR